jgi:hypothetical protein
MPVELETPAALDDIFLNEGPLSKRATLFPLGFPLELATNSDAVMAAAEQSWGMFPAANSGIALSLSITVTEPDDDRTPPRAKFRTHRHLMSVVADARNQVICDLSAGCAFGWVTKRMAEDTERLRLQFLEAPVMSMLVAGHLAAIHGALVTREGVGVLLCGESLAGKSTLAYACARSGWSLVSDDGTFLLRNQAGRYGVGNPYSIRFREDAKVLFPELENHRARVRMNGKWGMELRTLGLPIATASGCSIDHLVFLRRGRRGAARMNRFDASEAMAFFERTLTFYGTDEMKAAQLQAYRRLLDAGIWELHYSDLSDAMGLLHQLGAEA